MAATFTLHPSDLQANFFLRVQNISHKVGETSCAISKGCCSGQRPKQGLTQWNGGLVLCKTQALGSSNVKRDKLLETLAGFSRLFKICICKFYLYTYIDMFLYFYSYLQSFGVSTVFWKAGSISLHTRWIGKTLYSRNMENLIEKPVCDCCGVFGSLASDQ